jgi:gamma-glutamyltranspeptidase/glutathione hydrolase
MVDRPVYTKSGRSVVRSLNGMIATSQPLASMAGLEVLMQGGNAIDAAVAASAVLGVVEPFMAGIGGDTFTLLWIDKEKKLVGLNGSGRSAYGIKAKNLIEQGLTEMPLRGVHTITVPGAVEAWCTLLERYGTISLDKLLQPAIRYAKEGFPVSEIIAEEWKLSREALFESDEAINTYLINGRAPRAGEIFKNPSLGHTLELIARYGSQIFYEGEIAKKICSYIERKGGRLTLRDFKEHKSEWVEPLSTTYRGYQVYELPPNGQGAIVLEMLNILEGYDLASLGHNSAEFIHLLVEAKKIAFNDRNLYIADPAFNNLPIENMISKQYAEKKRTEIDPDKANPNAKDILPSSDTVYISVVDKERNCVSFISSIFEKFGSGLVVDDTGIILQNRGSLFSLEPGHFNFLEPNKRPMHTIIPAIAMKEGRPWLCFGVMGGHMQPQGHVQILINMIDFDMNVQEAGEAARVCHTDNGVALESDIGWDVRMKLLEKGHKIISDVDIFGGYQGILIDPETGALAGGSDPRKDGCAIGF